MEHLHQPYLDVMAMPCSRRHRFVTQKVEQIKAHNAKMEAANSKSRSKR